MVSLLRFRSAGYFTLLYVGSDVIADVAAPAAVAGPSKANMMLTVLLTVGRVRYPVRPLAVLTRRGYRGHAASGAGSCRWMMRCRFVIKVEVNCRLAGACHNGGQHHDGRQSFCIASRRVASFHHR